MTGTGYDEYLNALRDLDAVRGAQDQAAQAQRSRTSGITTAVDGLRRRVDDQRERLARLAVDCRLPPMPTRPTPSPVPSDPAAELTIATTDAESAELGCEDARYLAHRPKLLPRWRTDDRNGLVYGCWALVALLAQVGVLATAAGTESLGDMLVQAIVVALLPLPALAAGWLTIGVIAQPRLGEPLPGPNGKLQRNPRLGAVICFSTLLVSCALGNLYLN